MNKKWWHAQMLTMGEFRKRTAHVPDDAYLVADEGDCEAWDLQVNQIYPPVLDQPYLVVLGLGQIWSEELDYHHRIDARHALGDPE